LAARASARSSADDPSVTRLRRHDPMQYDQLFHVLFLRRALDRFAALLQILAHTL
jgi:hypothetical protein